MVFLIFFMVLIQPVCATDYTRMAQEILRSSQDQVHAQMNDARAFAEALPQEGSFFGFDVEELKAKSDEDLEEFVRGKSCKKGQLTPTQSPQKPDPAGTLKPQFLIFVSFGLPDVVLTALHDQAKHYNGRLVVRGLINDSFPDTQARLKTLGITVDIHPVWFDEYEVKRVPTFVLTNPSNDAPMPYDKVAGNVSCETALQAIHHSGELKAVASAVLEGGS